MNSCVWSTGGTDRGKTSTSRETCASATLSTTDPTWTGLELNQDLRGKRPTTTGP